MAKIVFIIVSDFRDPELLDTRNALRDDIESTVASITTGEIAGAEGYIEKVETTLDMVTPEEYDGIVLVGGPGMSDTIDNSENEPVLNAIIDKVNAFNVAGKLVTAICISPVILGRAGILNGKKFTCWNDEKKTQSNEIEKNGGTFVDEPVVADGNIITGNGPGAANEFGTKISEYLPEPEPEKEQK